VIKEDSVNENILYVGTDHGAYVSLDRGKTFMAFVNGLPAVPVHDLVIHPRDKDLVLGTHGRSIYVASMKEVQQLPGIENTDEFNHSGNKVFFDIEKEITHSGRWGSQGWWDEKPVEYEMKVVVYAGVRSDASIKVETKDGKPVYMQPISLERGLNYFTYNLEVQPLEGGLDDDELEKLGKKENGKYYLGVGEYKISIAEGGGAVGQDFKVKEPKARPARKE
jgi:hypothetical protein